LSLLVFALSPPLFFESLQISFLYSSLFFSVLLHLSFFLLPFLLLLLTSVLFPFAAVPFTSFYESLLPFFSPCLDVHPPLDILPQRFSCCLHLLSCLTYPFFFFLFPVNSVPQYPHTPSEYLSLFSALAEFLSRLSPVLSTFFLCRFFPSFPFVLFSFPPSSFLVFFFSFFSLFCLLPFSRLLSVTYA